MDDQKHEYDPDRVPVHEYKEIDDSSYDDELRRFDYLLDLTLNLKKQVAPIMGGKVQIKEHHDNFNDEKHWVNCYHCARRQIKEMLTEPEIVLILLKYRPDIIKILKNLYDDKDFKENIDLFVKILNGQTITEYEKNRLVSIRIYFWTDLKRFSEQMNRYLRCYLTLRKIIPVRNNDESDSSFDEPYLFVNESNAFTIEELYICDELLKSGTRVTLEEMSRFKEKLYDDRKLAFEQKPVEKTFGTLFLGSDKDNLKSFIDILDIDRSINIVNYKSTILGKGDEMIKSFLLSNFVDTKNKLWTYIQNALISPSRFKHKKKSNKKVNVNSIKKSKKKSKKKSIKKVNVKSIKKSKKKVNVKSKNKSKKKSKGKRGL
jgi:hypothetical protein